MDKDMLFKYLKINSLMSGRGFIANEAHIFLFVLSLNQGSDVFLGDP